MVAIIWKVAAPEHAELVAQGERALPPHITVVWVPSKAVPAEAIAETRRRAAEAPPAGLVLDKAVVDTYYNAREQVERHNVLLLASEASRALVDDWRRTHVAPEIQRSEAARFLDAHATHSTHATREAAEARCSQLTRAYFEADCLAVALTIEGVF